jgi:sensor histidine kinase YesM
MLNWNRNSFLCRRWWQSVCLVMLLLLLLWIWMTAKLEAIQQTSSSFLLSIPDKKAKLRVAWKPVTSSGSLQLYNKNRWQTILLSSYFLLLFIFRLCFYLCFFFHSFLFSENRNGQSRWIGVAKWKPWVKSGVPGMQSGVCIPCKCYVNHG